LKWLNHTGYSNLFDSACGFFVVFACLSWSLLFPGLYRSTTEILNVYRVLFVCTGNICRSPAAEAIVRSLAGRAGLSRFLEVDSAGTHPCGEGGRPDPRMVKAAARRAYDLGSLRARRLADEDFFRFDRVLAMDRQNLKFLQRECPSSLHDKLGLFIDFAPETGENEIPDPYYGNAEGFERVLGLCEAAGRGLVDAVAFLAKGGAGPGRGV
jgi:protein-tyrosine phosphatase